MSNAPTPPSGFPKSIMSYIQQANYLGNPLGVVGVFDMIGIVQNYPYLCVNKIKQRQWGKALVIFAYLGDPLYLVFLVSAKKLKKALKPNKRSKLIDPLIPKFGWYFQEGRFLGGMSFDKQSLPGITGLKPHNQTVFPKNNCNKILGHTNYGRPMKPFSIEIPNNINFGAFGVFPADLSAPILVQCSESLVHYSTIIATKN